MPTSVNTAEGKPAGRRILPPPRSWFTDRLLAPVVALFLLILVLFVGFSTPGRSSLEKIFKQQHGQTEKLDFGDTSKLFDNLADKDTFDQFIASNQLIKAFTFLSGRYEQSPSNEKRDVLVKLADYIRARLSGEAKDIDLTIPCREQSCGYISSYTIDMSSLKQMISKEEVLTDQQKSSLLFSLENAAFANQKNDKVAEFNDLFSVFQNLRYFWQLNKNDDIRNIALATLNVIKKTTPDYYESALSQGLLNLK